MSKFKSVTKQLTGLQEEMRDNRARRQAAEYRILDSKAAIQNADEALRRAVLKDDGKAVETYESEIRNLQDSVINRDSLLIEELDRLYADLQPAIEEKQAAQKKHFAESAAKVLSREIGNHDRLARELIASTKRLLTIYQLVRDAGHPECYRDAVGESLQFIPQSSIPVITDFNRSRYLASTQFPITTELITKISQEIQEA